MKLGVWAIFKRMNNLIGRKVKTLTSKASKEMAPHEIPFVLNVDKAPFLSNTTISLSSFSAMYTLQISKMFFPPFSFFELLVIL